MRSLSVTHSVIDFVVRLSSFVVVVVRRRRRRRSLRCCSSLYRWRRRRRSSSSSLYRCRRSLLHFDRCVGVVVLRRRWLLLSQSGSQSRNLNCLSCRVWPHAVVRTECLSKGCLRRYSLCSTTDCVCLRGCRGNLGGVVFAWSFVRPRLTALKARCVGFPCLV